MNDFSLHNFGAHRVRELEKDGEPWFIARDVVGALGLGNITEALKGLQEDELSSVMMKSGIQHRELRLVNEPGLYRLVFRSRKPEAEEFKRWIAYKVLPSIRKEGFYRLEREVSELKDKTISAYDRYFEASKECKELEERYRRSHSKLTAFEQAQIKTLLREGREPGEVAERTGRSTNTVRKIRKGMEVGA